MAEQKEYFGESRLSQLLSLLSKEFKKYVAVVPGKGLSTEDFTNDLKTKLEGIDLSKYSTIEQMNQAIQEAVSEVVQIKFTKPEEGILPQTGTDGTIYLIPNNGSENNVYDEYFWDSTNSKFEKFGTTEIDLTNYLQSENVTEITEEDFSALWNAAFPSD